MNHPLIIGAGGVASYLLPVLLKTFHPEKLTIIDKDVLEERNLDRQMFSPNQIGKNKATALIELHASMTVTECTTIHNWFTESSTIPDDVDCIICVADNHMARHAAILRAYALGINAYIGGNEYLDSQAFVANPDWVGTPKDPLARYPDIATNMEGSPVRCTGEAQEGSPQLAIANMNCAAKLLHLMWVHESWLPGNRIHLSQAAVDTLPCELFTSLTENSRL